jgi:RNA polymerase sigma-70 factor (TIGR02943 family)
MLGSEGPVKTDKNILLFQERFAEVVRKHTAEMLRFTVARVKEREVAEDLVQITFMAAWEGRDRFAEQSSPRTWLFSVLKNKLADHYRQMYRAPIIHGADMLSDDRFDAAGAWRPQHLPVEWPEEAGDVETMHRFLMHCLQHLPSKWRAAVEMKYLKENDAEAICQELGITATNYWQQLHRAKLKLRECITKQLVGQ